MSGSDIFLWVICAYVAVAVFIGGHVWRYRYDKFGWTTRSSELYESRLLRLGSPLFHFGILFVLLGHVGGILVPKVVYDTLGLHEHGYHLMALTIGGIAGLSTIVGMAILIYRRRTVGPVFSATTRNDKAMYVVLGLVILAGTCRHDVERQRCARLPRDRGARTSGRSSTPTRTPGWWPVRRCCSRSTCSPPGCCWRCGPSPGWSTSSPHRSATSPARTSSIAPGPRTPGMRATRRGWENVGSGDVPARR